MILNQYRVTFKSVSNRDGATGLIIENLSQGTETVRADSKAEAKYLVEQRLAGTPKEDAKIKRIEKVS